MLSANAKNPYPSMVIIVARSTESESVCVIIRTLWRETSAAYYTSGWYNQQLFNNAQGVNQVSVRANVLTVTYTTLGAGLLSLVVGAGLAETFEHLDDTPGHNARVLACARSLMATTFDTDVIPADCTSFQERFDYTEVTKVSRHGAGTYDDVFTDDRTYHLPSRQNFIDINYITPEAAAEHRSNLQNIPLAIAGLGTALGLTTGIMMASVRKKTSSAASINS